MLLPFLRQGIIEAGCDEAGRGCLAGPVFAAAVILPQGVKNPELNDSKMLTMEHREQMAVWIKEHAMAYAICSVAPKEIDEINILRASFLAMHRAVQALDIRPAHLIIDGNQFDALDGYEHSCIVRGDSQYASIAAASILAKTARDQHMIDLSDRYPHYGWHQNKGYPTALHRAAIQEHGPCEHHRMSFKLLPSS